MKKSIIAATVVLFAIFATTGAKAQEESKVKPKIGVDIVSSYIWRGTDPGSYTPHFQPNVALTIGNLEIGGWGSTNFTGTLNEADLYATYTLGSVTLGVYDYCWNPGKYFNYKNETTPHVFEGTLAYKGTKIPLSIQAGVMFYGADKKSTNATKNNYSTYFELGYSFKNFDAFIGSTPSDGYYGDYYGNNGGFAIVNLGVTGYKKIKFSESFELPVKVSFIANPQLEKAWIVVGISL